VTRRARRERHGRPHGRGSANYEAFSFGGAAETQIQRVKCASARTTLCPEERSAELKRVKGSQSVEA